MTRPANHTAALFLLLHAGCAVWGWFAPEAYLAAAAARNYTLSLVPMYLYYFVSYPLFGAALAVRGRLAGQLPGRLWWLHLLLAGLAAASTVTYYLAVWPDLSAFSLLLSGSCLADGVLAFRRRGR